jgi:hypothetical protein
MLTPPIPGRISRPRPGRRRTRLAGPSPALGLGALLLVALAACSAGPAASGVVSLVDPSASPDASAAPSMDPEDAMAAFSDCMREHGVDLQVRVVGDDAGAPVKGETSGTSGDDPGPRIDKDKLAAAEKACKSLLPQGGVNMTPGEIDPEFQDKLLAFAQCMREHGVDMPDPQFGSGGNTVTIGGPESGDGGPRFDPQSKTFQDAQAACGSLLPGKLGAPGTGGGMVEVKP